MHDGLNVIANVCMAPDQRLLDQVKVVIVILGDVLIVDGDEIISVWPRMLMPEANTEQ